MDCLVTNDLNWYSQTRGITFFIPHILQLITYITRNATYPLSDINLFTYAVVLLKTWKYISVCKIGGNDL